MGVPPAAPVWPLEAAVAYVSLLGTTLRFPKWGRMAGTRWAGHEASDQQAVLEPRLHLLPAVRVPTAAAHPQALELDNL